ncbi:arginase family protein [Dongia sp.]|uniref:arginase family protein n=1 Tax=Dongia sp. TaxID=1977262 RepID=UPI0035B478EB
MSSPKPFTLIGAPIDSVGGAGGTELSPGILRAMADWRRVSGEDRGDVPDMIRDRRRDGETGIIGSDEVIAVTRTLRREIADLYGKGRRPILLGGCCTQVVGALAGMRDALGCIGVAYLDGHLDLYDGETSPTGEGADMPLATALGKGPAAWMAAAGGASLRPEDVALIGPRDHDDAASRGSVLPADFTPAVAMWTHDDIHVDGGSHVAQHVRSKFEAAARPFWLAIDVDILDPEIFPATDYLQPDGLSWENFANLVKGLAASPQLMGLSVACYNPEKDPGYHAGRRLAGLLIDALEDKTR